MLILRAMRRLIILTAILLAILAGAGFWFRESIWQMWSHRFSPVEKNEAAPKPDPGTYATMIGDLERWRQELATRLAASRTPEETAAVEKDARIILEKALPEMMRCWLGTPWDFHGTAERPGEGRIACGYFVSTVLKDAGFRVNRYRLAQQPSENILRSFLPRESCKLNVGKPYDAFADELLTREPGIYIVGLDNHVAFLVVGPDGFRFIHSSGSRPWCVVDESRDDAKVLQSSNWRMFGNLTEDSAVLRRWLKAETIVVHGT
jgi:hypothetical protein